MRALPNDEGRVRRRPHRSDHFVIPKVGNSSLHLLDQILNAGCAIEHDDRFAFGTVKAPDDIRSPRTLVRRSDLNVSDLVPTDGLMRRLRSRDVNGELIETDDPERLGVRGRPCSPGKECTSAATSTMMIPILIAIVETEWLPVRRQEVGLSHSPSRRDAKSRQPAEEHVVANRLAPSQQLLRSLCFPFLSR